MENTTTNPVKAVKNKRAKGVAKAVTAFTVGAALLFGGNTFAIWEGNQSIGQQPITIQAGELSFDDSRATGSWTLNGVPVPTSELGAVKLVPGDKIEYSGSQAVRVVGDNLTGWLYFKGLDAVQGALARSPAATLRWAVDGQQEAKQLTAADHLIDQSVSFSVTMAPMGAGVYGDGSLAQGLSLDLSSVRVAVSSLKPEAVEDQSAPWIIEDAVVRQAVLNELQLGSPDELKRSMKSEVFRLWISHAPEGASFSELSEMPNLHFVSIDDSEISDADLATLATTTSVTDLYLSRLPKVTNLEVLESTPNLTYVNVTEMDRLTNAQTLGSLQQLQTITLGTLSAVSELPFLPNLKFAIIGDIPQLTSLDWTSESVALEELYLSNMPGLNDLSELASLPKLTNLGLEGAEADFSYSAFTSMTNLTSLSLRNSKIVNLSLLAPLSSLTALDISHTSVDRLDPLSELTNLKELWAEGIAVTDWSPVSHVSNVFKD